MNVGLVSTGHPSADMFPPKGGIQFQIYHTAKELLDRGHHPVVFTRDHNPPDDEIEFVTCSARLDDEILTRIDFGRNVTAALENVPVDVLCLYERFSGIFPSRCAIPSLFFTSNYDAMEFYRRRAYRSHPANRLLFPIKMRVEERVIANVDHIIALNERLAEYLGRRGFSGIQVVPNGVPVHRYRRGSDEQYVLYAGRLDPIKRVDLLLEAFAHIADEFPAYELRIAGDGSASDELKRLADDLGIESRIEFVGYVPTNELIELYAHCSLFVLPSEFETFGNTIVEAMASGKPVIATSTRGATSILRDGDTGYVVDRGDVGAIARRLKQLLENEAERDTMGMNAMAEAQETYSFDVITADLLAGFRAAFEKHHNTALTDAPLSRDLSLVD